MKLAIILAFCLSAGLIVLGHRETNDQAIAGFRNSLRQTAQASRGGDPAYFSIYSWRKQAFALTISGEKPHTYNLWKQVQDHWYLVFYYDDPAPTEGRGSWEQRVNELYERYGLPLSLRSRLEESLTPCDSAGER